MIVAQRVCIPKPRRAMLEQFEVPETALAPYEVMLQTQFSALSPGTELAYFAGDQSLGHMPEPYPFYPGYAAVGKVVAAGSEASVVPGDHVLAHVPHQSVSRFDCRSTICARLPDGVALDLATLCRLAQVGAVSVRRMLARPGDQVAVVGLGLVGNLAAQLARGAGMRVIGVEPLAARRDMAQAVGISDVLDPALFTTTNAGDVPSRNTCTAVLECSGQARGLLTALSIAAPYGEIFLVGAAWKPDSTVIATQVVRPIFDKFLALRSGWEWQLPRFSAGSGDSVAACTAWVLECLRDGVLQVSGLISDRVLPREAAEAYTSLLEHPADHMGVLIDWQNA